MSDLQTFDSDNLIPPRLYTVISMETAPGYFDPDPDPLIHVVKLTNPSDPVEVHKAVMAEREEKLDNTIVTNLRVMLVFPGDIRAVGDFRE